MLLGRNRLSAIFIIAALGLSSALMADSHNEDFTSKTSFSGLQPYTPGTPEHLTFSRTRMLAKEDGIWGAAQATIFGGQTTDEGDFARYFMPYGRTCLTVAEGPNPNPADATGGIYEGGSAAFLEDDYSILAHNFNITTSGANFQSDISFHPKQSIVGVALHYRQSISDNEDKGLWIDGILPIVHVKNNVGLHEEIINQGLPVEGQPANMTEAFQQCAWNYGKITPCGHSKTGVADLIVRLGYDSVREDNCRWGSFAGVIIPTGNHVKGKYLFEPIVGRAHHWGFVWGSSLDFELWNSEHGTIQVAVDLYSEYLFEGKETRSFDLKDKQWSRYINVYTDSTATTTSPGINSFTKKMKIRPHGTYQVNSAFIFKHKQFEAEFGLNNLAREQENGELCQRWVEGPAIAAPRFGASPVTESMNLATMHMWNYSLINVDAEFSELHVDVDSNVPQYKPLKEINLNINSALHPALVAHIIYGALAYNRDDFKYPSFFGLGGSYQLGTHNAVAKRWSIWAKAGLSF